MRTSEQLATRCRADGEFGLAARYWTGGLRLDFGESVAAITIVDGDIEAADPGDGDGVITLNAPIEAWRQILAADPPRFANDIGPGLWACGEWAMSSSTGNTPPRSSGRSSSCGNRRSPHRSRSALWRHLNRPGRSMPRSDATCTSSWGTRITGSTSRRQAPGSRCCCSTQRVPTRPSGATCSRNRPSPTISASSRTTSRSTASRFPRLGPPGGASRIASTVRSSVRCPSPSPRRSSSTSPSSWAVRLGDCSPSILRVVTLTPSGR